MDTRSAGHAVIGLRCVAVSPRVLTLSVPCCHRCLEDDRRVDEEGGGGTTHGDDFGKTTFKIIRQEKQHSQENVIN